MLYKTPSFNALIKNCSGKIIMQDVLFLKNSNIIKFKKNIFRRSSLDQNQQEEGSSTTEELNSRLKELRFEFNGYS